MRISRALLAPWLLTLVALTAPAGAETPATVGGEQLSTPGTVVGAGAPRLPATAAAGWLVADLDTGEVLAARNPHGRYAPASTLKTLTALTLIPKLDPRAQVRPSFADVNVEGTRVGLVDSVSYPVSQLFTAMLVVSGNDAANALASANGGLDKTLAEMNAEAARLQANDTRAVTPSGLDAPRQLSSAYDLALIARAGMQLPAFRDYVATKRAQIRGPGGRAIAIRSHDKLLYNYEGAIGIKNGYTVAAKASFVGAATRGGHTLLVTLMRTKPRYWPEAAALLDWGFQAEAAGTRPVGELVEPLAPMAGSAAVTPTAVPLAQPATSRKASAADKGLTRGPLVVAALVSVLGAALVQRMRRPRPRRRGQLRLPPL